MHGYIREDLFLQKKMGLIPNTPKYKTALLVLSEIKKEIKKNPGSDVRNGTFEISDGESIGRFKLLKDELRIQESDGTEIFLSRRIDKYTEILKDMNSKSGNLKKYTATEEKLDIQLKEGVFDTEIVPENNPQQAAEESMKSNKPADESETKTYADIKDKFDKYKERRVIKDSRSYDYGRNS